MPRPAKQPVCLKQLFQRIRSRKTVVVHEPQVAVPGQSALPNPLTKAAGTAGIDLHGADLQVRMAFLIFRQPVPGFIRGGVVHDQNIAGRCLGLQTGKAPPEQLTSVIGHNNGQNRHGFPSLSHLIQATGWLESFLPSSLALPSFSLLIMPPKAVISRIFKSSPKDQFSMYQRSCSTLAGMLVSPR